MTPWGLAECISTSSGFLDTYTVIALHLLSNPPNCQDVLLDGAALSAACGPVSCRAGVDLGAECAGPPWASQLLCAGAVCGCCVCY